MDNNLYNPFIKTVSLNDLPEAAWTYLTGKPDEDRDLQKYYTSVPWLFRGVDIRANAVATMPFAIYRGKQEFDTSEDYQNKVGFLPRPQVLFGLIEAALVIWNYAYAFKAKSVYKTKGVRYLLPTSVREKINEETGEVSFTRTVNGKPQTYTTDDIIYFWQRDPFVEIGPPESSPAIAAAAAARVLLNVDEFAAAFFARGAIKTTLLTTKNILPAERSRLKSWWQRATGVEKAWQTDIVNADSVEPVVIGEGLESLENTDLTESKRIDIAAALGIPFSVLFSNASNRATAEQDDLHLYTKTVVPECRFIEGVLNDQLFEPLGYRFAFTEENLDIFQADENERSQSVSLFMDAFGKMPSLEIAKGVFQTFGYELSPEFEAAMKTYFADKEERRQEMLDAQQNASQMPIPQPGEQTQTPPPQEPPGQNRRSIDLGKWQTKALKRVKAGKPAACPFESDAIDPVTAAAIGGALEEAETEADVKAIFYNVWIGYP